MKRAAVGEGIRGDVEHAHHERALAELEGGAARQRHREAAAGHDGDRQSGVDWRTPAPIPCYSCGSGLPSGARSRGRDSLRVRSSATARGGSGLSAASCSSSGWPADDALHLVGVEHFARQQLVGKLLQALACAPAESRARARSSR